MSAEVAGNQEVDAGPVIITVIGQEGHVPAEPVVEAKAEVVEVKTEAVEVVEAGKKEAAAGSEEQADQENRDEKGRFKPDAKTRIDQLTRARRDAERDAEYWKNVATGKIVPPVKEAPAAEVPSTVSPVREQFESEEAFLEALTDHRVDAKLAQRDQQAALVKDTTEKATSWQSKLESARKDIPDFDSVMDGAEIHVEGHVAELIMEHDQGAKVAHHFASNPAELDKVNAMTPAKAAFEIGKLAVKFDAQDSASSSKPAAVVKKVSEAPPPAARNVGSGRSTTVPLGEMSMEDYVATRKSQGAGWAR